MAASSSMMSIVGRIREGVGLSQSAVGALLEVSYQQVQKYERGINRISVEKLQRLAEALRVPMTAFFEDTPRPSPSRSRWKREGRITSSLLSQTVRAMCCNGSGRSQMKPGVPVLLPSSNSSPRCNSRGRWFSWSRCGQRVRMVRMGGSRAPSPPASMARR